MKIRVSILKFQKLTSFEVKSHGHPFILSSLVILELIPFNPVVGFMAGSSCFNPILYAFRCRNFQEGFKRMLCREGTGQKEIQLR